MLTECSGDDWESGIDAEVSNDTSLVHNDDESQQ